MLFNFKSDLRRSLAAVGLFITCLCAATAQTGAAPNSALLQPNGARGAEVETGQAKDDDAPLLTLQEAIQLATGANPRFQTAKLQAIQSLEQYKAQRTQYFPSLETFGLYSELLSKITITIPAGALGTFPSTGQIPSTATDFSTPRKPFPLVAGYASQPLTSLIRLHYSINSQRLMAAGMDYKAEAIREQQITTVKKDYTQILDAEAQAASSLASGLAARETARIAHVRGDQAELLPSQVQTLEGGPLWQPMCYAQIGGLLFATVVTLILVPVLYSISVLDLKIIKWEQTKTEEERETEEEERQHHPTPGTPTPAGVMR